MFNNYFHPWRTPPIRSRNIFANNFNVFMAPVESRSKSADVTINLRLSLDAEAEPDQHIWAIKLCRMVVSVTYELVRKTISAFFHSPSDLPLQYPVPVGHVPF